jgi:RNA polymerase sigma-70 factor (ECF subfamily)
MAWDGDLLERFRAGEPAALGEVYRAHADPLARALSVAAASGRGFAALRSAVERENTLLEVFARAFEPRARASYDGERPYGAYLMGIARHVVLERSREREVAVGLEADVERAAAQQQGAGGSPVLSVVEGGDAALALEEREVGALLEDFVAGLPEEERRLYALRFGEEGLPQERAAERLGLTRIQVRRRELALKRALLGFMQARGYLSGLVARGWGFVRGGDT